MNIVKDYTESHQGGLFMVYQDFYIKTMIQSFLYWTDNGADYIYLQYFSVKHYVWLHNRFYQSTVPVSHH